MNEPLTATETASRDRVALYHRCKRDALMFCFALTNPEDNNTHGPDREKIARRKLVTDTYFNMAVSNLASRFYNYETGRKPTDIDPALLLALVPTPRAEELRRFISGPLAEPFQE